jgi:RHS repeat-associated protein
MSAPNQLLSAARGGAADQNSAPGLPAISLPKGGGAIRGMGEKFAANPVTGTGSMTIPIAISPGRSGFGPQLSLSYDSGAGNGPYGFGWSLSLPSISRKTDKGLPRYQDADESDVFILSGAEDLVPALIEQADGQWVPDVVPSRNVNGVTYRIQRYRPRIEGLFARIERWTNTADATDVFWRSISKDNITTWYGRTAESRVADPIDPARIFSWLICQSYDDKGNAIVYAYQPEDSERIFEDAQGQLVPLACEGNRNDASRSVNRYLKRIKYGNRTPNRDLATWHATDPTQLSDDTWMFEVVFDYGEGHYTEAIADAQERIFAQARIDPAPGAHWPVRRDPFSTYRAGFEVRTYRLCQRVLMFHHFPEELGAPDYLVRSTDFAYNHGSIASFITEVTQSGYVRQTDGAYLKKSLPPLSFEYSEAVIHDEIETIDAESLQNLPVGVGGVYYQWLDLDGEGLQGVLAEQDEGWYYKRNRSPISTIKDNGKEKVVARFDPAIEVATEPSIAAVTALHQFLDLAGDGNLDVVRFEKPMSGFFERTEDQRWESFIPFRLTPNVQWSDPNLKFVDLTGDGHVDILITEGDMLTWYPSLAEEGFGEAVHVGLPLDEEKGARLVFANGEQSIYLADLSGDGLSDLVRIRNGEVCYWPNLGYGRFGAKVTMDNAPWFDSPDQFDPRRIRLADIDGSGTTDIIYLERDRVAIYRNECGNGWSSAEYITSFPAVDDVSSVAAVDLLGNGTACLVWSSPLPTDAQSPMRYIDLMDGQKPHLLIKTVNNLGAETVVHYAPSTKFYLDDKQNGKPWITRLSFPVHCVERVETYDRISRNRFVSRYSYHHGHFDGVEREFRGFGMVEQLDTEEFAALSESQEFPNSENIDAASHVPPVLTKTWFHTGMYLDRDRISNFFAGLLDDRDVGEYYREPGLTDAEARALLLEDTVLPEGLTIEEEREACRALKGLMLRQEVYGLDGSDRQDHPYTVTEQNFSIRRVQPKAGNLRAVFFTHSRETLSYHYDRNPDDPRFSHALTLEVDAFGNVLRSAAIGYGRRSSDASLAPADQAKQTQTLITCGETRFTNAVELEDEYRTPLPCERRTFELTGLTPVLGERFDFDAVNDATLGAADISYESVPSGELQRRLIEHTRTLYRRNDLDGHLPLGQLESLALPFEGYGFAFTPGLLQQVYADRVAEAMLADEGGYVHSEGDDNWWIPSGRVFFSQNSDDVLAPELAAAREHFFLPRRFRDPFGGDTTVSYDTHDLLLTETRDTLGNTMRSDNDYRVMQPRMVTDPNGNRSAAAFDALGMVAGVAVMGKEGELLGDSLDGFEPDLDDPTIIAHLQDPFANPHGILNRASARMVYDLNQFLRSNAVGEAQPNAVYSLAREIHDADLSPGELTRIQHSFSYSDGFGREIQKKIQAEPGPIVHGGPESDPRWVGNGWTIFNNKGKPIRQYEPFFSGTHQFEFARTEGVSPILFYDPVQRIVATLHPNHAWEKVAFAPWRQESWDVNDTVSQTNPRNDLDAGEFFRRLPEAEYLPTWSAQRQGGAMGAREETVATKAAAHAETPTVTQFDTLGRPFLTVARNRFEANGGAVEERYETRMDLDIEGNQLEVSDARGRIVMRYDYDTLGNQIHSFSMEAGERWTLNNVAGQPIRAWNSRGHILRIEYDELHRPTRSFVTGADGNNPDHEILFERTVYGESQGEALNQRGRVIQVFDGAGVVTNEEYDFKGNLRHSSRQLLVNHRDIADWNLNPALESETFTSDTTYDALNRPIMLTAPDKSRIRPFYNEANLLERVEGHLRGGDAVTAFVNNINYNSRGQRELIEYGNGVRTIYEYDRLTFRLARLMTLRGTELLQDITYTYDPIGNIADIHDDAQQTIHFNNQVVEPHSEYAYDAIYRLIEASGREHIGQISQPQTSWNDQFRVNLPHPGDGQAMRRYNERYEYDEVGNILRLVHQAQNGNWTRAYAYNEPSLIEPALTSNRLSQTDFGSAIETFAHDAHGNMTRMPHLPLVRWNYLDQLEATSRQVINNGSPETTYYVYDAAGQRARKVTERQAPAGQTATRRSERIYLGGFEIYREYGVDGATIELERQTLHVMDDQRRVAVVETRTEGNDGSPTQLLRYQLANHLGSASLELDEAGQIISYEEYYPHGSSSYQAIRSNVEASPKRYRYTGKERDEESGFSYHGARYYAAWLGRWTSPDPIGIRDGVNQYAFVSGNPIRLRDSTGASESPFQPGDLMNKSQVEAYRADPTTVASGALPVLLPDRENYLVLPQGAYTTHPGKSSGTEGHLDWSFSKGLKGDYWEGVYGETADALAEKKATEIAASRILASKKMIQGVAIVGVVGGVTGGIGLTVSGSLGFGGTILFGMGEGAVGGGLTDAGLTWLEGGSAREILSSGGSGAFWGGVFGGAAGTLGSLISKARRVHAGSLLPSKVSGKNFTPAVRRFSYFSESTPIPSTHPAYTERQSARTVMGKSASDVTDIPRSEWLHLHARRFGGGETPYNLVAGSFEANYQMGRIESLVDHLEKLGRRIEYTGSLRGRHLRLRLISDDKLILNLRLDVRTQVAAPRGSRNIFNKSFGG